MKKNKDKNPELEQLLTGEYIGELEGNNKPEPNAELERGEYLKFPDTTVQKVVGERHTNGGVEMFLPDGTRILSDHLKVTADQKKFLKNNFDIDVSTKDTYAKAIEKYSKKIGLKKLNEEQEDYFKELKKQEEIDESTSSVNNQFLNEKIYEIEQDKKPLDQERSRFFDVVYKMQEQAKKESGEEYDNSQYKYGGITRINFDKMLKNKGLTEDQALSMIAKETNMFKFGGKKKYQDGDAIESISGKGTQYLLNSVGRPINYRYVEYTTNPEVKNQEGQTGYFAKYSKPVGSRKEFAEFTFDAAEGDNFFLEKGTPVEGYKLVTIPEGEEDPYVEKLYSKPNTGDFSKSDKIKEKFYKKSNFKQDGGSIGQSDVPYKIEEAFTEKGLKRLNEKRRNFLLPPIKNANREDMIRGITELQEVVSENTPEIVSHYMLERSHQPTNELKKHLSNKLGLTEDEVTQEKVKDLYNKGKIDDQDLITGFKDSKWWYRAPETTVEYKTPEELEKIKQERGDEFIESGDLSYLPSKEDPDVYTAYVTSEPKEEPVEPKPEPEEDKGTDVVDKGVSAVRRKYPKYFYTPYQGSLPPSPMEPHLKVQTRFRRLDPVRVGIEDQLQASADTRRAVEAQLQDLPPSQRAAMMSNIVASTQEAENQAITQATRLNAENLAKTELFNAGQADKENVYSGNNALDFERRQLTAKAKTEEEMRNWLDQNRRIALNNFQNQQKLNLMSELFPDYELDFWGNAVNYEPEGNWELQDRSNRRAVNVKSDV